MFPIANPPSPLSVPRAMGCSAPSSRPYEMEMGSHPGPSVLESSDHRPLASQGHLLCLEVPDSCQCFVHAIGRVI